MRFLVNTIKRRCRGKSGGEPPQSRRFATFGDIFPREASGLRVLQHRFSARYVAFLLTGFMLATGLANTTAVVVPVFHPSFQAASAAAAADQSLVLLVFSAEWCGPCKLLKSKTLSAPEFLRQENPLHIADVDIDAKPKMAGDFAVEAVPTLVLLTPDGKIISRQTGFMEPADLLAWLTTGRARAAAGQWEGTAPGAQFGELIKQAAADNLGTNEIQKLVDLLGDTDPANRDQAGKILLGQRERAVPPLIEAAGNGYLGTRIAAAELLQRLAPNAPPADPWQSPTETSNAVVALRTWWAATGQLPPVSTAPTTNLFSPNSVKEALEQLRGDDPVRRTAAMTTLVRFGPDALPAVREAARRAEKSGDQRTLGLLDDVRWTMLVPDAVEQQSGGVRNVLARGKSSERQAATERLGRIGRDSLGILIELAGDPDPLVVESAVRALSGISGGDTVPALSVLLKSPDSNLRMTAAQALGRTKTSAAVKPLLAATGDSDEVVACTALSALEETQSRESSRPARTELSPEIIAALRKSLADPRWRVRASAAEVAGKLSASQVVNDVKKLLNDPDGFVVKSALTALGKLGATPESELLTALSKRLPSLQGDAAEMILRLESEDAIKTVTDIFNFASVDGRVSILGVLAKRETSDDTKSDEGWKTLLTKSIIAPDPRLRRGAAEVLLQRSPKLAAKMIEPLLADEDRQTRQIAANVVLRILDRDSGGQTGPQRYNYSSSTPKTNKPVATAALTAAWHAAMLKRAEPSPELGIAAAIFLTGDGKADLPMLLAALNPTNAAAAKSRSQRATEAMAIGLIAPKLSLPGSQPVLDRLAASPLWYALAASQNARCKPEVTEYFMNPARFKAVLEAAGGDALSEMLGLLAGYDYENGERHQWSLWTETDRTKALTLALAESTNAAWRAAAVFSLGLRADAKASLPMFEKAAGDPDPWVRGSAIRALARNLKDRTALEQRLAPRLAETNATVATAAALALLEPEIRQAAGLEGELSYFEYESHRGGRSQSYSQNDQRPLTVLPGKPEFLPAAREHLAASSGSEAVPFALLLAQYGEFEGVDRLAGQLATLSADSDRSVMEVLLAGIALSRDNKYLPALKQIAATRQQDYELRKVLQALKGMTGADARQLRLDINKKIRSAGGSSSVID